MRVLGCLVLVLFSSFVFGQNLKQCLRYGEEKMQVGDYYGAIEFYEKAMNIDSASIDIIFKYAEALRLYNDYDKALYYHKKVAYLGSGKIYPESLVYVAELTKNKEEYREALDAWKSVKKKIGRKSKTYYGQKSRQEISSCNWANKNYKDSTEWEIKPFKGNTDAGEFALNYLDSVAYFTSMRARKLEGSVVKDDDYRLQIYRSDKSGEETLDTLINSSISDNGEAVFSADGKRMYFTRCIQGEPCHIYISRLKNGEWSKPDKVGSINGDNYSSVQPYLATIEDEEYLFFSSTMEGGEGGLDLYYSIVTSNGNQYSAPKNLGNVVNSPDDEVSPYYNEIERKLYFSSSWHRGFGGLDIFSSNGKPGGKFSQPRNLGKPANSSANDLYYKKVDLYTAVLASNREGGLSYSHSTCCNDLYILELPHEEPESGDKYESLEDLNLHLPVTLYFHNDRPNPNTLDTFTNLNYLTTYQRYHELIPTYKKEYSKGLSGEKAENAVADIEDFFFDKVDKGVEDLEIFTRLLIVELEKGQKIEMTVQGYASPLAATDYNVKLTYRRVSSMINYLREYDGGKLAPYIDGTATNGGSLSFVQIPFGEYTANQKISDNPQDKQNSVFSRAAALERKIEIQSVQIANETDSAYAEIKFDKEIYDFGILKSLEKREHTFTYRNTGKDDLVIESIETESTCLTIEFESQTIKPGGSGTFKVIFDPTKEKGKNMYPFIVKTNGFPKEKKLGVTADIP